MTDQHDAPELEDDAIERIFPLRHGGALGIAREYLIIARKSKTIRVNADDVVEVSLQPIDWFLVVMSVVIAGFGVLTANRSAIGGVAFVAFGVLNLYWTYRKRGAIRISVEGKRKTVTFRPEEPREAFVGLKPLLGDRVVE